MAKDPMKAPPGLRQKHGRTGFELRFRLPEDVAQLVGQHTWVRKIPALNRKSAIREAWQVYAALNSELQAQQKILSRKETTSLSADDLRYLREMHFGALLDSDESWRVEEGDFDDIRAYADEAEASARRQLSGREALDTEGETRFVLELHGYDPNLLSPDDLNAAARALAQATRDAAAKIKLRDEGEDVSTPPLPSPPHKFSPPTSAKFLDAPSLIGLWKSINAPSPKTVLMGQSTLDQVLQTAGIRDVRQLTKTHVGQWRSARLVSVKPKTIEKDLALLKAILNVAVADGLIPDNPAKVAMPANKDTSRHDADAGDGGRSGFSDDELFAIFGSEIWSCNARFAGGKGEAQYWLPILGLFTGARLDELAHLRTTDVFPVAQHRCSVLRTRDGRGDKLAGGCIPLHPALEALGFLDYVEHIRAAGKVWLFPELPEKWSEARSRSSAWGTWWSRYNHNAGREQALYHRFRHTFTDIARHNRMAEEHARAISGHRQGNGRDAHDHYGTDGAGFAPLRDDYFERYIVPRSILELIPHWVPKLGKPAPRQKRKKRATAA